MNRPQTPDPDPDYNPGKGAGRLILDYIAAEGRVNPWMIRKRTGLRGQRVNDLLQPLLAAKWVIRPRVYDVERNEYVDAHAMYEYNADGVYDPDPITNRLDSPDDPDQ